MCDIQDLLKILCSSPSHLYAIAQYLAINILYSLTLPISKTSFCYPRNHSPIALPIAGPPFFLQFGLPVSQPLSVPVSVTDNTISPLKPFLKSSSLFGYRPTHFFIPPFTPLFLCPPTRLMPHTSLVHSITISLNFSHSFSTLSTSPHFIFSKQALLECPFFITIIQFTHVPTLFSHPPSSRHSSSHPPISTELPPKNGQTIPPFSSPHFHI